jgi:hypothetical protein
MIFSGVIACCADVCASHCPLSLSHSFDICEQIPNGDREAIAAGIQALGGQYRYGLTKDVTHLFVLSPEGVSLLLDFACMQANSEPNPTVITHSQNMKQG